MRTMPSKPPDMLAVLIPIVEAVVPQDVGVGPTKDDSLVFVQLRADLQNPATPLSRYCRVGITVWWQDQHGNTRLDKAFDLSNEVVEAIMRSHHPAILDADWQSGPADTIDTISKVPIQYSTILLEVTNDL